MRRLVRATAIAALLAGCGGSATPTPSGAPPTRSSEQLQVEVAATARALARSVPTATPTVPPLPTVPRNATPSPTPGVAIPKDRPITYVAIGASDAVGVGAQNPARDGWVPQVHRRLPAGSKLVNLGVSGAKLSQAVAAQMPKAIEAKPDLVTVWNVVNDLNANVDLATYERDLDRLLRELTGKTTARVVVANSPDLGRVPAYEKMGIPPDALRQEVGKWNAVIARTVAKYPGRVYLVDLYARSAEVEIDETMVAGDDFHPSAKGYAKLAEVVWEFLVANRVVAA